MRNTSPGANLIFVMNRYLICAGALLASLPFSTGCFPVEDSCNIKTDGLYLQLEAIEEDGNVEAQAIFWVGSGPGGTYLELGDCGDSISVNGQTMNASPGFDNPEIYVASIEPAASYSFELVRPDEDPYVSTVSNSRAAVTVTAPNDVTVSRAEALEVVWENNDAGEAEVTVSGACFYGFSDNVQDDGAFSVAPGSLDATDDEAMETCNATVVVDRVSPGAMANGLDGDIRAVSRGRGEFTSTP